MNPGIYGLNPGLQPDDLQNGNLVYNIDYRQIYTSIIQDWFKGDNQALIDTGFSKWVDTRLPIVSSTGVQEYTPGRNPNALLMYPNPVQDMVYLQFNLADRGDVTFRVLDSSGRVVRSEVKSGDFGTNKASMELSDLSSGLYLLQMIQGRERVQHRFLKL